MVVRVSYILHIFLVLLFYFSRTDAELEWIFNADYLFVPTLFQDVIVNGNSISDWYITPAPYIFPDILFYIPIQFVISDFRWAILIYSLLQYLVILILLRQCIKLIYPNLSTDIITVSNVLMALFILSGIIWDDNLTGGLILTISSHTGAFVCTLLAFYLMLKYLQYNKIKYVASYALVTSISLVSDRLLIFMFYFPVVLLLLYVSFSQFKKKAIVVLVTTFASFALGILLYKALKLYIVSIPPATQTSMSSSITNYTNHISSYFTSFHLMSVILVLSLISFFTNILFLIKKHQEGNILAASFHIFVLSLFLSLTLGTVLLGFYKGADCMRYNIHGYYVLIFTLPLTTISNLKVKQLRIIGFCSIAILSLTILAIRDTYNFNMGLKRFNNFSPYITQLIDKSPAPLKSGISDYWTSKHITAFSEKNIKVLATYDNLIPILHITSESGYLGKNEEIVFNFIVGLDMSQNNLEILDTVSLDYFRVYLVEDFVFRKDENGNIRYHTLKEDTSFN